MYSIKLNDKTARALDWLAKKRNTDPETLAIEAIEERIQTETRRSLEREAAAFRDMHAQLLMEIPGEYAAIYQGELVDHDQDMLALLERIEARYPDEPVLIRQVLHETIEPVIHVYSPRIEHD